MTSSPGDPKYAKFCKRVQNGRSYPRHVTGQKPSRKRLHCSLTSLFLDLGLPTLNGIEAAKLIQQRCPESRVIFLTQIEDRDIMSEALRIPRARYILKINVVTELLDAISAALHDC